jgi:hypothetical protein
MGLHTAAFNEQEIKKARDLQNLIHCSVKNHPHCTLHVKVSIYMNGIG